MEKRKALSLLKKITVPPAAMTIIISLLSAYLLIDVFLNGKENTPIAYFSYFLSAYALLSVICTFIFRRSEIKEKIGNSRLIKSEGYIRWKTDIEYRAEFSLGINLLFCSLNIIFRFVLSLVYKSYWFYSLTFYYLILCFITFFTLQKRKRTSSIGQEEIRILYEKRKAWIISCLMLVLNYAMSIVILFVIIKGTSFSYPGIVIYISALHAFYSVIHSCRSVFIYEKTKSPLLSVSKTVKLEESLMSMLALQTPSGQ